MRRETMASWKKINELVEEEEEERKRRRKRRTRRIKR